MVDTKGLTPAMEGKRLRLFFRGGEVCEAVLLSVNVHGDCPFCAGYADFWYHVTSSNQPASYANDKPDAGYAAEFPWLEKWELLE